MAPQGFSDQPKRESYDVVIVGGAIMGSASAWFLTENPDFNGSVLVIERDPSYTKCASVLSNSSIRQQFSTELNVRISQFTAEFIKDFRTHLDNDERVPDLPISNWGYLYLADNEALADTLRANQKVQVAAGAETRLLTRDQIAEAWPFYKVDDIVLGSINTKDEGYWDGATMFEWFRRSAIRRGVEYVADAAVAMGLNAAGTAIESVTLKLGAVVHAGTVVNASGPRGALTARMAGVEMPIEPRKRYTWVFEAEKPLDRNLPLTINPSGVHMRQDGPKTYLAGTKGYPDTVPDFDDFTMDRALWEDVAWPAIAERVPQFESIRVINEWAGHYDYNAFDQNAILGRHPEIGNFIFQNGFSGHGLQQSPAMGRAVAELITYGGFRTLDMSPFNFERILRNEPIVEGAII